MKLLITGITGGLGWCMEDACKRLNLDYIGTTTGNSDNPKHIRCDFTEAGSISKIESVIVKNDIDCLVNNAGIYSNKNIASMSDRDVIDMVNINLVAPILLSKYLYRHLIDAGRPGLILNINSLAGRYPSFHESVYCATKYGLSGLGASLSINQKSSNIRVIDVYLGAMNTPMTNDRPNQDKMMSPTEISNFILDLIQNNNQYVPSSIEIRNAK